MWNLFNLLNIPLSLFQNLYNARTVRQNNAFQSMLVDKQNKAAEMQAEKAYRRSLPSNQIAQMRSAGISDFGAAQAISGGATYNPAPVNTANTEAPQMDLSGAMQAITSAAQLNEQKRQFDIQQREQKRQFDESLQLEKDKHEESKRVNTSTINHLESQTGINNLSKSLLEIEKEVAQAIRGQRLEAEQERIVAERASYILSKFRDDRILDAMLSLTSDEIHNLFELQAYLSMIEHGIKHDSMSALYEGGKKVMSWLGASKGAGSKIRTH